MMEYSSNIFEKQLNALNTVLAILLLIFSIGLYHSLFGSLLRKHLQRIFFQTKDFQNKVNRSFIYLILTSFPMLILVFVSLFFNKSFIGLEISMSLDQLSILIVSGYICWLQESRHTPIRGMHLIRDILFAILSIGVLVNIIYSGQISVEYAIVLVVLLVVYYFTVSNFNGIQSFILRILGLKQSNNYNAKFLLTSKYTIPDFLQIKDLITQKQQIIKEQLSDYHEILANLQQNEEDQEILMNFARLFLPIKKACQIKEQLDNKQVLKEIQNEWDQGSVSSNNDQDNQQEQMMNKSPTWNQSSDNLGFYLKNTYTDDFVNQEDKEQQLSTYQKILKYCFYPIYVSSFAEGRLYFLVGYVGLLFLVGSMFGVSNSSAYFSYQLNSMSIVSILVSLALVYPSAKYCIQISSNNDYDFTNIFIQCMILKSTLMGVFLVLYYFMFDTKISINNGAFTILIARICLLGVYLAFMIFIRFATRYNNFKYFTGLLILTWTSRIIAQNVYNEQNQ